MKIKLSRYISDYQNNFMDSPIELFYFNSSNISNKLISGKIINGGNQLFELGLYEVKKDSISFVKKTQADIKGKFKFQNIKDGDYRICAIQGIINDFNKDYRFNRYGLQSKRIFIDSSKYNFDLKIIMDAPLPKNDIIAAEMINSNYSILTFNDGSEKPIYIKSDRGSGEYLDGDSIFINIYNENRFEKYLMNPFSFLARINKDTIPASIDKYYIDNDILFLNFSEPVKFLSDNIFFNNDQKSLNYKIINPFTCSINLDKSEIESMNIMGGFIFDYGNNSLDSLITINIPKLDLDQKFGSLKGKVNTSIKDVVVRLTGIESDNQYYTLAEEDSSFSFAEVIPGLYVLDSYERKISDFKVYYSGEWDPYNYAAKFSIYPDSIDIRAHWIIEGIEINYD